MDESEDPRGLLLREGRWHGRVRVPDHNRPDWPAPRVRLIGRRLTRHGECSLRCHSVTSTRLVEEDGDEVATG